MKNLIIIFLLFTFQSINAQDYILEFDKNSNYNWKGIDENDIKLKNEFYEYCIKNEILEFEFEFINYHKMNSSSFLTTVDLNNDGILDIVYNGPSGGEPNNIYFFVQNGEDFRKVFFVTNGIVKVEWENQLLSYVYTYDSQCCGAEEIFNTVYKVKYDSNNEPIFKIVYQSTELLNHLRKPKSYLQKPINFIINNRNYKLRFKPEIDDNTDYNLEKTKGNTIALLDKGMTGKAFASETDKTGRVWWYVEIAPNPNIKSNVLTNVYNEQENHLIGWLSSRFVTIIEE